MNRLPSQRIEPWTGSCPACGSLDVEKTAEADPNSRTSSWTCAACDHSWGVRRGRVV